VRERKRILIMLLAMLMTGIFMWLVVLPGCDPGTTPEDPELEKQLAELEARMRQILPDPKAERLADLLEGAFDADYIPGVTAVRRATPAPAVAKKKVWVYVDGLLTPMSEHDLMHMIRIGFYILVVPE